MGKGCLYNLFPFLVLDNPDLEKVRSYSRTFTANIKFTPAIGK